MLNRYLLPAGPGLGLLLLAAPAPVRAQAPTLLGVTPAANARSVPRNASITATFSQPLTAASAAGLKVFSSQRGGLRGAGPATVAGSTLTFAPTGYDYRAGETVQYTLTTAVAGAGGPLATPRVGQFVAATGGTGVGVFGSSQPLPQANQPIALAVGDVNGDGHPDLVAASAFGNTLTLRLSLGAGSYAPATSIPVDQSPQAVALADLDGDGDLDLLAVNLLPNTLSVRLNDGAGNFGGTQAAPTDRGPTALAVGDLDADGDLDVVVAAGNNNTLNCLLNNGSGLFSPGPTLAEGVQPNAVALGDLDNDGDLDVVATSYGSGSFIVHVNDGRGGFATTQATGAGGSPTDLALGDVDGDGYLDAVTVGLLSNGTGLVFLHRNTPGSGFGGTQTLSAAGRLNTVALGDLDHDGDLDLLVGAYAPNLVYTWANNGFGTFGSTGSSGTGAYPTDLVLADLDRDGDLDWATSAASAAAISLGLNGGTGPLAAAPAAGAAAGPPALAAWPNPATGGVQLTLPATAPRAELLDALGRVVRTVPARAGAATLDVAGLPAGLYLVRAAGQQARLVVE